MMDSQLVHNTVKARSLRKKLMRFWGRAEGIYVGIPAPKPQILLQAISGLLRANCSSMFLLPSYAEMHAFLCSLPCFLALISFDILSRNRAEVNPVEAQPFRMGQYHWRIRDWLGSFWPSFYLTPINNDLMFPTLPTRPLPLVLMIAERITHLLGLASAKTAAYPEKCQQTTKWVTDSK